MVKRTWGGLGRALVALAVVGSAAGCGGSGGNNDQGIVFRATGIFRTQTSIDPQRITCTEPVTIDSVLVDTASQLSLSGTAAFPDRADPDADPCGGFMGLVNNLSSQSINVTEVSIRYEVAGAAVQVPSVSVNVGQTVPPASCDGCTSSGQNNLIFMTLVGQIVPSEIIVFLSQNVNRLPATPYQMDAFIVARGQSDQGTNYESNEIGYTLTVIP